MRPDPVVEFWLGMSAIVAALAVALLLAFPPSWMDHRIGAVTNLNNVSHLAEGSTVSEKGFVWGTVTKIEAMGGYFRVHMKLDPKFTLAAGTALALEETNPLQAASLVVGRQCRLQAGAPIPPGCCPEKLTSAGRSEDEIGLASCGSYPSLIDKAVDTVQMAQKQMTDLRAALDKNLPPLQEKTNAALLATTSGMVAMKSVSEYAKGVLTENNARLGSTLANADSVLGNLKTTTAEVNGLLTKKRDELDASITNVSSMLATTAATMPVVVDNLQKSAEDLRAVTGQIRNEPTSLVRRRQRSDPSFVDPAPEQ
jgi:hypothetical protein